MPKHPKRPTGPEDPTPGPEFILTRDQFDELRSLVPKKHLGIRLRDRGATWIEAEMLDAEGAVIKRWVLPPIAVRVPPHKRLREIELYWAAKEREAASGKPRDNPPSSHAVQRGVG